MIRGAIPGGANGYVAVRDAIKKPRHADAPYPAGLVQAAPVPAAPDATAE